MLLTSQRLVHAPNAAVQLEDPQGLHLHAAAAASQLGLPVPHLVLPPPALLPRLWFRGFSVPLLPQLPRSESFKQLGGPGGDRGQRGDNGHKTVRPPK